MMSALEGILSVGMKRNLTETVLKANRKWLKCRIINALYAR